MVGVRSVLIRARAHSGLILMKSPSTLISGLGVELGTVWARTELGLYGIGPSSGGSARLTALKLPHGEGGSPLILFKQPMCRVRWWTERIQVGLLARRGKGEEPGG